MNFDSIDNIPMYNYQMIIKTGNLALYGVKDRKDWEKIEQEFFEEIGYGEKFFELLRIRVQIAKKKMELLNGGSNVIKTLIELDKAKIKQMQGEKKTTDFALLTAQLSKFMGFKVDDKTTTVKEYYSYLKLTENG